ncbi:MAG: acyltransferase, partial [Gammaproteobacteria bacterium]|nr:acyltransferase [Gammaproteobacteria bacterium]
FAFFQLPTRLWELLAGSLLAVLVQTRGGFTLPVCDSRVIDATASLSLLILIGSMFVVTLDDIHPGLVTAIPVFATVLYIASARPEQWLTRVLSSKPFVWIGLLSYSLYLWHYPIFSFARIKGKIFYTFEDKLLLIALTFVLSVVGYFLVEKRFRNPKKVRLVPFWFTTLGAVFLLAIMLNKFIENDNNERRFEHLVEIYGDAQFDNHKLKKESVSLIQSRPEAARFKDGSGKIKVVIMGNSHGKDFYNVFAQNMDLFSDYEFEYIGVGIGTNPQRFKAKTDHEWFQKADVVLVSNKFMPRTHKYAGDLAVLGNFIDKVKALGKPIVILSNTVEFAPINDKLVFDWYAQNSDLFKAQELNQLFYQNRVLDVPDRINLEVARIAKDKGVLYLEKSDFMCDKDRKTCVGVTPSGHKVFYDYGHYTLNGAKYFGERIADIGWFDLSSLVLRPAD